MKLKAELFDTKQITHPDKVRMFQLMETHYENMEWNTFLNDLMEKEWVLILKDSDAFIQGFTTIKIYDITVDDLPVRLVFSGDTIIHKKHWGDRELHRAWIRAIYSQVDGYQGKTYWLLISKGYKTYRFLPVYFHTFYPCCNRETPEFEKKVIDAFGMMKYPEVYNAKKGIIYMQGKKDYLKEGVADITENRLRDPHVQFFASVNPGHVNGDELVCLTELSTGNMKPIVFRYLRKSNRV